MDNTTQPSPVSKSIGYWLLTGAVLVIAMVILGGYTRLSHSGLSMVTWKPVTGVIPPMNENQWQTEFQDYQTSPEYKLRNYHFTLDEFKEIYWPEFYHRLLGRIMGLAFIVPFIYFLIRKKFNNKKIIRQLIVIFLLGLLQGFAGWYMVASGLVDRPAVSHYRLAIHLCLALLLFSVLFIYAIRILKPELDKIVSFQKSVQRIFNITLVLLVLQIIYGAFVAGLKAGLFYPTFPKMGTEWIPQTVSGAFSTQGFSALTESPFVVQFIHRWLAILVTVFAVITFIKTRREISLVKKTGSIIFYFTLVQVVLGVITLLNLVPVSLGVIHQLMAVFLLSSLLFAVFSIRRAG